MDWLNELTAFIEQKVQTDEFSGTVLVADGEHILFEAAYGLASKRFNVPNQVDTKFNLGSINKMFTKVLIWQLMEAGELNEHDIVRRFLPDFPNPAGNQITINHLLTHRSGLGDFFNDQFRAKHASLRTVDDHVALFINDPILFEPGTDERYSNAGFMLLGKIIEVVTGRDYYEYVREKIYHPAGMPNTDAYEMDKPIPNLAIGYYKDDEGNYRNNLFVHSVKGGPAGGGFSTLHDLHHFVLALCDHTLTQHQPVGERGLRFAGGFLGINSYVSIRPGYKNHLIALSNYNPPSASNIAKKFWHLTEQEK